MATIDLTHIRATPRSQRDSFESLAVQLFRAHCKAPFGSQFYSLRGEGGDGGVEAYFLTPTKDVLGVQAKYFFALSASEMRQVKESFETALANHPSLTQYWIYLPFDLTGIVAQGKRGKSEVERFEEWRTQVVADAKARGRELEITLCSAVTIESQLLDLDKHGGLRRYWFNDAVLAAAQVESCLSAAAAFAGPRYMSTLDVTTSAHLALDFFGGIGDFQGWIQETWHPLCKQLRWLADRSADIFSLLPTPDQQQAMAILTALAGQSAQKADLLDPAMLASLRANVAALKPLAGAAMASQEKAFYDEHGPQKDTPAFRQFSAEYMCTFPAANMDASRELVGLLEDVETALTSPSVQASHAQSLLLRGPAGIGKTHALVSAAYRRFERGGYSLLVFGDDFGSTEPWEVLRSKLGFGAGVGRGELLECMQACADNTGLPFVIAIDALNESPRTARWKDKLPELLQQCKPFSGLKVIVSARDTYLDMVVDERFPGYAFTHEGFEGQELEALQAFADYYGLDTEIAPLFAEELSNPLFLHLICRTFQDESRQSIDVSLPGFSALFERYLERCDKAIRGRLGYANPKRLVRAAMLALSGPLADGDISRRTWSACVQLVQPIIGAEVTAEAFLKELEYEGLVILSPAAGDEWVIRFGYQRYGDVLRALALVQACTDAGSCLDIGRLRARIEALTPDDEGLLEVLASVLPERTHVEITEPALGIEPEKAHRLFVLALPWRSRESCTPSVLDHVYASLHTPGLWQDVYESFFKVCLVPGHILNAEQWLHEFLRESDLVMRDAYLSVALFKSYDANGAVKSLIHASLKADISRWPSESRWLAVLALSWTCSASDRRVRDLATKGLTRLFLFDPKLISPAVSRFRSCDDDYVLESLVLAAYSACLLSPQSPREFQDALATFLDPTFDSPNILIRDNIRLLGECIARVGLDPELAKQLKSYPSKLAAPAPWPTAADAEPLLSLKGLPLNMKLWGHTMAPDFWRYIVEPRVREFDLKSAGVTGENLAAWIMVETLRLGYPGRANISISHDQVLIRQFGPGRGRKGYAERLGKKYYWIAFHRLIGVLADNLAPRETYNGHRPGPGHYWSLGVRKADVTDVRDIFPAKDYPEEIFSIPPYAFPEPAMDVQAWVLNDDFCVYPDSVVRTANDGQEWVALSIYASNNDKDENEDSFGTPFLDVTTLFTSALASEKFVCPKTAGDTGWELEGHGAHCYRTYFAEYPNGTPFKQCVSEGDTSLGSRKFRITEVSLLRGNEWEYDYSSEGDQESLCVPCPDLVNGLGLTWDRQGGWVTETGELAAFHVARQRRNGLFVRRDLLDAYLTQNRKILVYRRFATRGRIDPHGDSSVQIDMETYLKYSPSSGFSVLKTSESKYGC